MSSKESRGKHSTEGPLSAWSEDRVWFRDWIRRDLPWGREETLDAVPPEAEGCYGLRVGAYCEIDGQHYQSGEIVTVSTRAEWEDLLSRIDQTTDVIFPWYERLVPVVLLSPHARRIELDSYRSEARSRFIRSLVVAAGAVALGYFLDPALRMLTLLIAAMYGLFPMVEAGMTWSRRLDRLSVDELNRRLVNFELFRRWLLRRRSRLLQVGVGFLTAIFVAQIAAGLGPSIEAAALVKERVREDGEWWRLVTTGLMHGGLLHIVFNGMALYSLGRVVVALVSPSLLGVVFLATVVTGSLASLFLGPGSASVGASGGILGILGFLLAVSLKFRTELPGFLRSSLVQSCLVMALFGFLGSDFIDNAAHAGGFLGGLALAGLLWPWLRLAPTSTRPLARVFSVASLAVLAAAAGKIAWELWLLPR